MLEDVALTKTHRGKFTFTWDEFSDVVFNERAVYPVLTTLATRKGEYAWDSEGTQGTLLHTVKQDKFTTGSQLRSYAQDGGNQVIAEGSITAFDAQPTRLGPGSWELQVSWHVKSQPQPVGERVRV